MSPAPIHLAVAFDRNYLTPLYVLLTSIFRNNKASIFQIHAIATGISGQEKAEIQQFAHQNTATVYFYEIDEEATNGLVIPKHLYFTVAAYYRLFFPALVPATVDKLLYLDTDIVVLGDLAELYCTPVSGYSVAAVAELNESGYRPDLGIHTGDVYFNSGVMLINIPEWKKQNVSERAIEFIKTYPDKIIWVDQDALNAVLLGNYVKLSKRFNVISLDIPKDLPKSKYNEFLENKCIIHYNSRNHKPWDIKSTSKYRYLYHQYLKLSPRSREKKFNNLFLNKSTLKAIIKIRVIETLLNYPRVAALVGRLAGKDITCWL